MQNLVANKLESQALTDWCYHLFGGYPIREETTLDPKMTWEKWIFAESQRR